MGRGHEEGESSRSGVGAGQSDHHLGAERQSDGSENGLGKRQREEEGQIGAALQHEDAHRHVQTSAPECERTHTAPSQQHSEHASFEGTSTPTADEGFLSGSAGFAPTNVGAPRDLGGEASTMARGSTGGENIKGVAPAPAGNVMQTHVETSLDQEAQDKAGLNTNLEKSSTETKSQQEAPALVKGGLGQGTGVAGVRGVCDEDNEDDEDGGLQGLVMCTPDGSDVESD